MLSLQKNAATVDRGNIMVRIHRWSVMIYGSLQAIFMEAKYNTAISIGMVKYKELQNEHE